MICCCIALLITAQGSLADTLWTENTEYYSISVDYPAVALENEAAGERLEEFASGQIQNFKDSFEEYFKDDPLQMEWNLEINFTHEPSPDGMLCIIAWMWSYTGGVHGNSWTRAFVFDLANYSVIGPVELLGGQTEFETFAEEVMVQLNELLMDEGWIEEGASPTAENYHTVFPVPDENGGIAGYTVLFPPYQVECYAYGTVEVYVPAD
ncbi:MAG: DUF4163 domain-containing protein [Candidatus Aegiribacteria sp.]|nr:DUF4163 domain-containing protein [Candidatus Aegiribacteria sp.]